MNNDSFKYEKFTPITNSDLSVYEKAIDFVFENDDIRNVAISGSYGAGKSSILESYKKKHQVQDNKDKNNNHRYIHISLAHFSDNEKESHPINDSVLERKIINQLIHQISPKKIPQSNFKIKRPITRLKSIISTVLIVLFTIAVLLFIFFKKWVSIVNSVSSGWFKNILASTTEAESRIVFGFIAIGILFFFVYVMIHTQRNKHILKRISFKGNEIEVFDEAEESYFDKYLNEILYLFDNNDADVIVFEDMDRFEANHIFERLREVNTLINLQRKKNRKVIRFFYLLRDDIFEDPKDRTKFFDYIIPIVPVIDGSNSYSQFISHFKDEGILEKFDGGFLHGLSLYVDDMRVLKSIFNEFHIYYMRLNSIELDCNKMLAMIVYKNLFPKDFSDLQQNKGFVFTLFEKKQSFVIEERKRLKEQIEEKETEIKRIEDELLESEQELNDVKEAKRKRVGNVIGGSEQLREYERWEREEYPLRLNAIQQKHNYRQSDLEKELQELRIEVDKLESLPLKKIINRENIDRLFAMKRTNDIDETFDSFEIRQNNNYQLVKYLIRNGYIDETYADYMTYFYEGGLSTNDKIFLRSITDKKAKEYKYKLDDPKIVFERLDLTDFDQEEVLNNSLMDFLIHNNPESEKTSRVIAQLKTTNNYTFIEQYYSSTQFLKEFLNVFSLLWPEFFSEIKLSNKWSVKSIRLLSIDILNNLSEETIQLMNKDEVLSNYISSQPDYLSLDDPIIDKIIRSFGVLNVSLKEIDAKKANYELLKSVYDNGFYEISFKNISEMLLTFYKIQNKEDIHKKTTTLIYQQIDSPLKRRITNDMSTYVSIVIKECDGMICDDENAVLIILNNDSVSNELKGSYIEMLSNPISDLTLVKDKELWKKIVENKCVECTGKTIAEYYAYYEELDEIIVDFMNHSSQLLNFSDIYESEDSKWEMFTAIIECSELDNEKYEAAIISFEFQFGFFNIENIPDEKIKILIKQGIIEMNADTLAFMRKCYPNVMEDYITRNIEDYIQISEDGMLVFDEAISVLSMDVKDKYKKELINLIDEPISIKDVSCSAYLQTYILRNRLSKQDLPDLFRNYSQLKKIVKDVVRSLALENIDLVIDNSGEVDGTLLEIILKSQEIENETKIKLVIAVIPYLTEEKAIVYLSIVGKKEFTKVFDIKTNPRYEDNDTNRRILDAFKKRGWVYDYRLSGRHIRISRKKR